MIQTMATNNEIRTGGAAAVRDTTVESGRSGSGGSAMGAVAVFFAWVLAIAVCNILFLCAAVFGVFLVLLAGYAYPSVSELLSKVEVVPMLEEQIDKYLPGFLSKYRAPDTARAIIVTVGVLLVIGFVLVLVGCFRLFLKAGVHPVLLFIPIVNLYQLCSIAGGGFLMFLGMLLPGVQLIAAVAMNIGFARSFGRSAFYAVPLLILPPLFLNLLPVNRDYLD